LHLPLHVKPGFCTGAIAWLSGKIPRLWSGQECVWCEANWNISQLNGHSTVSPQGSFSFQ